MEDTASTRQRLAQMIVGFWTSQALHVAAHLRIADLLAAGPRTAEELAGRTASDSRALYRVLRALAGAGVFEEDGEGRFALTPLAAGLRTDDPATLQPFAVMAGTEFYQAWGELLHTVQTGEQGFRRSFGMPFFSYMTRRPDRHAIYDAAMTAVHGGETEPMLEAYDFAPLGTVMDVGGGNGSLLAAILARYPAARGILFDLPAVADRAREAISGQGLSARCEVVGGDFFTAPLPRADAVVLRHVLHDWEDAEAIAILRQCRATLPPGGRILVVEMVIPAPNEPSFGKWLDLMMLLVGGRERTSTEYGRLFDAAGLTLSRIVPTRCDVSIVEGVPSGD
ncbi:MAG: methyltransferase domain-containing protein [Planctomycetes bacterium]|nr:methyltransferase domain-containing protein [Planctomycetota bacterium]